MVMDVALHHPRPAKNVLEEFSLFYMPQLQRVQRLQRVFVYI